jgi:hypothetical protein
VCRVLVCWLWKWFWCSEDLFIFRLCSSCLALVGWPRWGFFDVSVGFVIIRPSFVVILVRIYEPVLRRVGRVFGSYVGLGSSVGVQGTFSVCLVS